MSSYLIYPIMKVQKTMEFTDFSTNQVNILTPDKFALLLEQRVHDGLSYLESIMEFCEKYDVEHSTIKKLLTPNIIASLKQEAINLNLIKGGERKKSKGLI